MNNPEVPVHEKALLTLAEAAAYSGIGINTLRDFLNEHSGLTCFVGKKRLIKREKLRDYLSNISSI